MKIYKSLMLAFLLPGSSLMAMDRPNKEPQWNYPSTYRYQTEVTGQRQFNGGRPSTQVQPYAQQIPAAAQPAFAQGNVTDKNEQYHLTRLQENLDKISAALPPIAASYITTLADLATLQPHQAAVDAIVASISNASTCVQIIHWFRKANEHFDALSKTGVSAVAQAKRDELAPKLRAFKVIIEKIKCKVIPGRKSKQS